MSNVSVLLSLSLYLSLISAFGACACGCDAIGLAVTGDRKWVSCCRFIEEERKKKK